MNKDKKEFLDKCIKLKFTDEVPILGGIYVIPTNLKHESGYKIMYIIGHTPFEKNEEGKYYLIDECCDVIDFISWYGGAKIENLHIDITTSGIIHIWSTTQNLINLVNLSNCSFEAINKNEQGGKDD